MSREQLNPQQPAWERYDPRSTTGKLIVGYLEIPSTMDVAWEFAAAGGPSGMCIIADRQTQGRGRFRRRWHSADGDSLLLSILLRIATDRLPFLSIVSSLACLEAIAKLTGCRPMLKWPNDLLWCQRKLAGVLVETRVFGDEMATAVIGLGLNMRLGPITGDALQINAASVSQMTMAPISKRVMLDAFLTEFDSFLAELTAGRDLIQIWKQYLSTLGQQIVVYQQNRVVQGIAEDVDPTGSLVIRTPSGKRITVSEGEVTLAPSGD